jgi:Uma2 family endonuclease
MSAKADYRLVPGLAHSLAGFSPAWQSVTFPAILIVGIEPRFQGNAMATVSHLATTVSSSQEWKDVLEEILPPQGEWSEDEYLVLTDHRNRLVEFTDGFLQVVPTPTDKHQSVLGFLFLAFHGFVGARGGKVHFVLLRLRVRPGKFREPDLLLLLSAADPRRQNRFWLGADLALEVVSDEKPERDLVDKRGDYAEGQVPEYWIVNPQTETITVLRLRADAYEEAGVYRRGQSAASELLAGFSVAVAEVFDAD